MQVIDTSNDEISSPELTQDEVDCLQQLAEGGADGRPTSEGGNRTDQFDGLLESAQRKLSAKNRLHAVSIALRRGIVRGLTDKG